MYIHALCLNQTSRMPGCSRFSILLILRITSRTYLQTDGIFEQAGLI
jgi:hypothetical protein